MNHYTWLGIVDMWNELAVDLSQPASTLDLILAVVILFAFAKDCNYYGCNHRCRS